MFKLSVVTIVFWLITILAMPSKAVSEDPTRPPDFSSTRSGAGNKKTGTPRWVLSSTLISKERRSAIINDRVVVAGETISGARVVEIEPLKVTLNTNGRKITLMLLEKNIKTPARSNGLQEGQ